MLKWAVNVQNAHETIDGVVLPMKNGNNRKGIIISIIGCIAILIFILAAVMLKNAITPIPTPLPTEEPTPSPTDTPVPTSTPVATATTTPSFTPTPNPTSTPTPVILGDVDEMDEEGLRAGIVQMGAEILTEIGVSEEEERYAVLGIWQWVDKNIQKDKDRYPEDEIRCAYSGLKDRMGGIASQNAVFASLVEIYGIKHMKVTGSDGSGHTWNLCCVGDSWYHFDYYVPSGGHYVCFMQTDEQVSVMTMDMYPHYHYYDLDNGEPTRAEKPVYNGYLESWYQNTESRDKISEEEILAKLKKLEEEYPSGKYWNYGGVSDIPCDHSVSMKTCNRFDSIIDNVYVHGSIADQCRGFGNLLSDSIFGADAGVYAFTDYDDLRVGDLLRIMFIPGTTKQNCHTAMVIEKNDEYVLVAEANYDYKTCRIRWGGKYTREYLESCATWYISRY